MTRLQIVVIGSCLAACAGASGRIGPTESGPGAGSERGIGSCGGDTRLSLAFLSDEQRAELETVMKQGVAVVHVDCERLDVLRDCTARGSYRYEGASSAEAEHEQVRSGDDTRHYANGEKLSRAAERAPIEVDIVKVGRYKTTASIPTREQLSGACSEATHLIISVEVGALRAKRADSEETFGAGDLAKCTASDRDAPSDACSAMLDARLAPLRDGERTSVGSAPRAADAGVPFTDKKGTETGIIAPQ